MDILGILGNAASGGLLGILGAGVTKFFDLKEKKLTLEERARERTHELAVMQFEATSAEKLALIKRDEAIAVADADLQGKSYGYLEGNLTPAGTKLTGKALKWALFVDGFARLVRPCTTIYFQLLTTLLGTWAGWTLYKSGQQFANAGATMDKLVDMVIFLTSTIVLWWFGGRGTSVKLGNK